MERLIRVTGKGSISAKPDQIRLQLDLSGAEKSYEKTMEASAKATRQLQDCLQQEGFAREEIKTCSFSISDKYERIRDENGDWRQVPAGYEFHHGLKVEFAADSRRLGEVLRALGKCSARPEFQVAYTVRDPEALKNELIRQATEDSTRKARVLAEASGVNLGPVMTIEYAWESLDIAVRPMGRALAAKYCMDEADAVMEMEPEDIRLEDTVTVTWQIL